VPYRPQPIPTASQQLSPELRELTEQLAKNTHDVWARQRLADGWTFGPRRDDAAKEHPGLVPYEQLAESERKYDRNTAMETLKAVVALGYRIEKDAPPRSPHMGDDSWDDPLRRLAPEVRAFSHERFVLGDDLQRLAAVRKAGAPEAVILYAARILEVLAAAALHAVRLPPTANLFGNLDLLERYNLIPAATRHGAHALRRQGNAVRHVGRLVTHDDADLSVGFTHVVLRWYFCTHPRGPKLRALTDKGFAIDSDGDYRELLAALGHDDADVAALADRYLADDLGRFARTPVLPAVLVERLLDRNDGPRARSVLDRASRIWPEDLRLRQLDGLHLSRSGWLDEAIERLETLEKSSAEDEETVGILAGAYKRRWQAERGDLEALKRAHRLYRGGWERARKTSTYLGINAATTALWLGRTDESQRTAADVLSLFEKRATAAADAGLHDITPGPWDLVTFAEARLLLGEIDAAAESYQAAFRAAPPGWAGIEVSRKQAAEDLRSLGNAGPDVDRFLAATQP
jgi:tetratricopeptide (TPR) repeat protein